METKEMKWQAHCDIDELPTRLMRLAEYRSDTTTYTSWSMYPNSVYAFLWNETPEGSNFWAQVYSGIAPANLEEVLAKFESEHPDLCGATKQQSLDSRYMRMAYIWAENSYCERRKVGALIVKDKMIISDGYNGTPSGFPNVCENEEGSTFSYVLHAEANAITKVAKSTNNCEGATLYVTTSPCIECSKLIIQSGIRRVVYSEEYRNTEGIELLKQAGIEVDKI